MTYKQLQVCVANINMQLEVYFCLFVSLEITWKCASSVKAQVPLVHYICHFSGRCDTEEKLYH